MYNTRAEPHYFLNDPNAPSSYRISGGSSTLIKALSKSIKDKIKTTTFVTEIIEKEEVMTVVTKGGNYCAEKVIITIPPRILLRIFYFLHHFRKTSQGL